MNCPMGDCLRMRVYKQVSSHIVDYDDDNGGLPITEVSKKLVFMPDNFDADEYEKWVASQNDDCEKISAEYIGDIDVLDAMYEQCGGIRHGITVLEPMETIKGFEVII